ncbi:siderophore-interacting protein [Achromobacter xylosoxidans]
MQPFSLPRRDVPCIVLRAREVARDMRRLTLGGPELSAWLARPGVDQPGAWVKVFPPGVPGRAYTLRGIDFEASSVEIDFVVHGDAPGTVSEWARRARPGDAVSIAGPRDGGFSLLADTRWVWLGADASAWPAASRIIESLPGGIQVLGVRHPAGDDDWPAIASARAAMGGAQPAARRR